MQEAWPIAGFSPLAGMRVLDFSKVIAGPLCAQYLGDMGADVIKIEPCGRGDDTRHWPPFVEDVGTIFLAVNRNKRSLAIDLKSSEGRDIIRRLVPRCDVVLESFGPGVTERLGIGYDALKTLNPGLVYCSVSGYGTKGPMKDAKGYDLIAQAFSGMMSITGEKDGPPMRSPFSPVDQGTGLHAVIAILGALLQRTRTGEGMKLETSLFDTAVGFLSYYLQGYWSHGKEPERHGAGHESLCPYQAFDTADKPVILGIANDALWVAFCEVAGVPELARDPRFLTGGARVANRAETVARVQDIMRRHTRADWLTILGARAIPCVPVNTLGELAHHPQLDASDLVLDYRSGSGAPRKTVAAPVRAGGARMALRTPPPRLGEHSRAILTELGLSADVLADLGRRGIVAFDPAAP